MSGDYGIDKLSIKKAQKDIDAVFGDRIPQPKIEKSDWLSEKFGTDVFLVKTNESPDVNSFKARGASYMILQTIKEKFPGLHESLVKGKKYKGGSDLQVLEVVAASEGNHAQGSALAIQVINERCREFGIPLVLKGRIYMSTNADQIKVDKTERIGGKINGENAVEVVQIEGEVFDVADEAAKEYMKGKSAAVYVPPFDHPNTITGAATQSIAIDEKRDKAKEALVIAGMSGGGLSVGSTMYFKRDENVKVVAAGTSCFPNGVVCLLNRGKPIKVRGDDLDDPHPIAVGGASVVAGGEITGELGFKNGLEIYTAHPEQLAWLLREYLEKEIGFEGTIEKYFEHKGTNDIEQIPELAGLMSIAVLFNNPGLANGKGQVFLYVTGGNISQEKARFDLDYIDEHLGEGADYPEDYHLPFYKYDDKQGSLESLKGKIVGDFDGEVFETDLVSKDVFKKLALSVNQQSTGGRRHFDFSNESRGVGWVNANAA